MIGGISLQVASFRNSKVKGVCGQMYTWSSFKRREGAAAEECAAAVMFH